MFGITLPHLRSARRARTAGFTLVELLTVIVIIAILAAITLNISKLILRKQSEARARSEMLTITGGLESFRSQNPDYPPMENSDGYGSPYEERNLFMALYGHARWTISKTSGLPLWETVPMGRGWADGGSVSNGNGEKYTWGKEYIEPSKFTFDKDDSTVSHIKDDAVLYDPWWDGVQGHNAYLYRYKSLNDVTNPNPTSHDWQAKLYLLITRGPDGLPEDPEANFPMKSINGHSKNSGILKDDYGDPVANPGLSDNIVMGSSTLPPQ